MYFSIVDKAARQISQKGCIFVTILKVLVFYLSMHKLENCLHTTDFYCVHGTHRSVFFFFGFLFVCFFKCTEQKNVRTYAVCILIYFAASYGHDILI